MIKELCRYIKLIEEFTEKKGTLIQKEVEISQAYQNTIKESIANNKTIIAESLKDFQSTFKSNINEFKGSLFLNIQEFENIISESLKEINKGNQNYKSSYNKFLNHIIEISEKITSLSQRLDEDVEKVKLNETVTALTIFEDQILETS